MPRTKRYAPGDVISFRIPVEIGQAEVEFLNRIRKEKGHKFGGYISGLFFEKVREEMLGSGSLVIPLPQQMSEEERRRIDNPAFRELLGLWVYHLAQGKQVPPPMLQSVSREDGPAKASETEPAQTPRTHPFLRNLKRSTLEDD